MLTKEALIKALKAGSQRHYSFSREHDDTSPRRTPTPPTQVGTDASVSLGDEDHNNTDVSHMRESRG